MAIVRINDWFEWLPEPWVHVTDGPDTTEDETYHIKADKTSVHGMRICTTGSYYGASDCGFVTQLGMTATYASGVTVHNLGRSSFCGTNGDSGAPMYAQHDAFGLQVGGFSECDSVYQGIKEAETKLNLCLPNRRKARLQICSDTKLPTEGDDIGDAADEHAPEV